jgi:hypothetical protein
MRPWHIKNSTLATATNANAEGNMLAGTVALEFHAGVKVTG